MKKLLLKERFFLAAPDSSWLIFFKKYTYKNLFYSKND